MERRREEERGRGKDEIRRSGKNKRRVANRDGEMGPQVQTRGDVVQHLGPNIGTEERLRAMAAGVFVRHLLQNMTGQSLQSTSARV